MMKSASWTRRCDERINDWRCDSPSSFTTRRSSNKRRIISFCFPGNQRCLMYIGKVLQYSLPSVGPGADPGVQVTWSHPPGGRLPLLSARPAVIFLAEERHRTSAGTKLYCLVTEVHACEQLAQGCYLEADRPRFEPATFWIASERSIPLSHTGLLTAQNENVYIIVRCLSYLRCR